MIANEAKQRTLDAIRFGSMQVAGAKKRREYAGVAFLLDMSLKALASVPPEMAEEAKAAYKEAFDTAMEADV